LEQVAPHRPQLGEDLGRDGIAGGVTLAVLADEPLAQLVEPLRGGKDAANDELRRHGPVPAVLREPERDIPPPLLPVDVEARTAAERDRRTRVGAVTPHAETQMLPLPDRRQLAELATGREQGHLRVAETERCEAPELRAEVERQPRAARDDRVDARHRL